MTDKSNLSAQQIAKRLLRANPTLFRNDNGLAYHGRLVGDVMLNPRPVRYGLAPGSADFVGWEPVVITPDMVGRTVAVFKSVETKTEHDRLSAAQRRWNAAVRRDGGVAEVWRARGPEIEILKGRRIE